MDMIDSDDNGKIPEDEYVNLVDVYTSRTKRKTRGLHKDIGLWATRNPVSTKKIIDSIIKAIIKKHDSGFD